MDPDIVRTTMRQQLKDKEWKDLAKATKKSLQNNFYGKWTRVFLDKPDPVTYKLEEVCAFIFCWTALMSNQIACTEVVMNAKPNLDNPAWNAMLLAKPQDDTGEYYGGLDDSGYYHLGWRKPLTFAVNKVTETEATDGLVLLPPMKVTMEVGHNDIFELISKLSAWRHLARWPSDADRITVLQVIDPNLWTILPQIWPDEDI